jgi:hypothetical protein
MTRLEALAAAHREAARAIRNRIDRCRADGFAKDWPTSENIRTTLEEVELRHIRAAERLAQAAAKEVTPA